MTPSSSPGATVNTYRVVAPKSLAPHVDDE